MSNRLSTKMRQGANRHPAAIERAQMRQARRRMRTATVAAIRLGATSALDFVALLVATARQSGPIDLNWRTASANTVVRIMAALTATLAQIASSATRAHGRHRLLVGLIGRRSAERTARPTRGPDRGLCWPESAASTIGAFAVT